jgi:LysM repeat protein
MSWKERWAMYLRTVRRYVGLGLLALLASLPLARAAGAERPLAYTVAPGDTLPAIAQRFGIPLAALLHAHDLGLHDTLYVGDRLLLPVAPAAAEHVIAPGETLQAIASRYGVATLQLAWRNGVLEGQGLIAGRRLLVPDISGESAGPDTAVARPGAGQRVSGAVRVSGWGQSHNNELRVELRAPDGALLAQGAAAIHAEIGQMGAFAVTLTLPADLAPGQALALTVSRSDRQSGESVVLDTVALTSR